ncbi:phospholipase D-like domain-containing protein [Kordiimonas sp. SCSIO 12610]|uniref:phospholipase D-like domain-containing protein n=1 Tax=Kordiimonas sp. SCSIO 12610 TaxID=2829597 RepID=UPI00210EC8CA|nr:phospholipase D-like domain-containing protein [Kordiimonas sp. SCSIO 12610]UTW55634.1 PLDc N-terminal domain-containing protein [Kordiimonas sp. SCSIO 12610]
MQEPHDNLFGLILPDGLILAFVVLCAQILTSIHILSTKDQVRSAIAWIGLVWLAPVFGLFAYFLFGISRIRRRAKLAREKRGLPPRTGALADPAGISLAGLNANTSKRWIAHDRLAGRLTGMPLAANNQIAPLRGGREAYNAMIEAIENAERSIALTTYIFQADQAGRRFVRALVRAKERGVEVRVLVDAVGNWYGFKPVSNLLRRHNIAVGVFNPARLSWRLAFFNLRTHRKLLIVDGRQGFAGGMNIRKHHLERSDGRPRVRDTHFSLKGPIVNQMMEAFADDWIFTTGESLQGNLWFALHDLWSSGEGCNFMIARAIADGPDEPRQKTAMIIESALAAARRNIKIVTPYFLPNEALLAALEQAALRGVEVQVLIPEKSNLPLFGLAAFASLKPLIRSGCKIFAGKAPFDHTKLMIVDEDWVLLGSSNWDARSLKLNFEFNIECYDACFAKNMNKKVDAKLLGSKPVTIPNLNKRGFFKRLFGRILWLATPYL